MAGTLYHCRTASLYAEEGKECGSLLLGNNIAWYSTSNICRRYYLCSSVSEAMDGNIPDSLHVTIAMRSAMFLRGDVKLLTEAWIDIR